MKSFSIAALTAISVQAEWKAFHGVESDDQYNPWDPLYLDATEGVETYDVPEVQPMGNTTKVGHILMGFDNSSFIYDWKKSSSVYEHYRFLGGSLMFTADVGDLGCGCEANVFLASPEVDCLWESPSSDAERLCPTIDVMRANGLDFITGSDNCANGSCDRANSCTRAASDVNMNAFGRGDTFEIDSAKPFKVFAQFMTETDRSYDMLTNVKVTLSQGDKDVEIYQNCGSNYLNTFVELMNSGGHLGTSIKHIAAPLGDQNPYDQECQASCNTNTVFEVSDFQWWETNSYQDPAPTAEAVKQFLTA